MLEISFEIQQTSKGATLRTTFPSRGGGGRTTTKRWRNTPYRDAVHQALGWCHTTIANLFDLAVGGPPKEVTWTIHYKPAE